MQIRFWGTRGSLAKPGPATLRYGGNTSCVEVSADDGTVIILDSGTGIHELGRSPKLAAAGPVKGHILISHTHWDHIQGFPFFAPLFVKGNEWDIYAPAGLGRRLEETLAGQMEYAYFPVTLGQLGAVIRFHDLAEDAFQIGQVRIRTRYLSHPVVTMGYRLEAGGVTVVYASDHEPHYRHHTLDGFGSASGPVHLEDSGHIEFLRGADLVIHDAQYTLDEYPLKLGWGHTPAEMAVDYAAAAGVRRLALFHHDPLRHDEALDELLALCRRRAGSAGSPVEILAAAEGMVLELSEGNLGDVRSMPHCAPGPGVLTDRIRATILVVDDDPDILRLLTAALQDACFSVLVADSGERALELARGQTPDLILLDRVLPALDGLSVCRELRSDVSGRFRTIPIVLLTSRTGAEETAEGFAAGATDYLTKPFNPAYVRARVEQWLVRTRQNP